METAAPARIEHRSTDPDHLNELHPETRQIQTRQSNNGQFCYNRSSNILGLLLRCYGS
ncbi:hypothetical protein ARMGADRAFT_1016569 [Armillaria gallica]|uniref:Uncharacterized protein n=1 Tax=Armillaria gallica TaxID=47427 RepID=A0A2H3DF60_ARMGA|nr:hypothetical protein ARMGADRAFT_1016569 [Armillaria gallica]